MQAASETCKRLASHLHKSNIGKMLLEEECKESEHFPKVIPQSMDVRWDSKYSNMDGVLYHQDCLLRLARKGKLKVKRDKQVVSLVPTMEEFDLIETAVKVLKVCQVTTKIFEQEAVPTLPLVVERLYNMDSLLKELQEGENQQVSSFCDVLRENLSADNRFPNFGMENELNCMANYLNPRLRGCHLRLDRGKFEETKRGLVLKFSEWGLAKLLVQEEEMDINEGEQAQVVKKLNPTELLKQQLRQNVPRDSAVFEEPSTAFEEEMGKYEANDADAPENTDVLQWWKHHAKEYPRYKDIYLILSSTHISRRPCLSNTAQPYLSSLIILCSGWHCSQESCLPSLQPPRRARGYSLLLAGSSPPIETDWLQKWLRTWSP